MDEIFKAALAVLELGVLEPRAQILGGLVIFDLENFSLQQAWHVTPSVASKVLDLMGVSYLNRTLVLSNDRKLYRKTDLVAQLTELYPHI